MIGTVYARKASEQNGIAAKGGISENTATTPKRAKALGVPVTPAYKPLASAVHLQGTATLANKYVVNCDENDAKSLLAVAERDCPTAVQPIKAGLIAAQARKERDR